MDSIAFAGSIAENYEKYLRPVLFNAPANDIVNRIPKNTGTILELAAGTGIVTELIMEKFPNTKITVTDLNPDMLKVAQEKITGGNIEWAIVNAEEIPYGDNTFDCVICQFGIMFVPERQKMVNESYRVLKPGGTLLFNTWDSMENMATAGIIRNTITGFFKDDPPTFYNIPFSMYEPSEMEGYLKNAGFKNISVENLKLEGTSETAEDAAKGFIDGNPIYTAICERDESLLPVIKKAVAEKIAESFGNKSLKIPLSLFVTTGTK